MNKLFFFFSIGALLTIPPAFAQVEDDFSDGDFTQNPEWSGAVDKFSVAPYVLNESNLMLRSNSAQATYYLSTPSSIVDEVAWEFFINLRYQVSSANLVDVYLMADNADLLAVQNGYFLRFGRTSRDITFWKEVGGSEQLLLEGPASQVNSSSNNPFNIRVTRSADGLWNILVDPGATGSFQSLGLITDAAITSTSAFGIKIVQSSAAGPVNNHWFDNFIVAPIPADVTPPAVLSVEALSANQALLTFDEPLEEASAGNPANYLVNGGIGIPVSAEFNTATLLNVTLTFAEALNSGQTYTLNVSGVEDLAGNAMDQQSYDLIFFELSQPALRQVVFNEMMIDETPQVGLPLVEWVEIRNTTSDKFFDLAGWRFVNTTTEKVLTPFILAPGALLILCDVSDVALMQPFGAVQGISSFTALSNTADSLTLLTSGGEVIDFVSYKISWYQDSEKDDGGWTLEQINPLSPCSGSQNWRASVDPQGGTPGAENSVFDDSPDIEAPVVVGFEQAAPNLIRLLFSEAMDEQSLIDGDYDVQPFITVVAVTPAADLTSVILELSSDLQIGAQYNLIINGLSDCSGNGMAANTIVNILFGEIAQLGDLVISEIMADPTPAVGLPAQEYFEIFNASNKVIDIQGCDLSGEEFTFPRLLEPGDYVMCVSSNAVEDFQAFPDAYVINGMSLTFLTNGGRELVLTNQQGELVNEVTYSSTWFIDPSKVDGGWSLEIINPFTECSGAQNWRESNNPLGGTPGAQNSVYNDAPDTAPPVLLGFSSESTESIILRFNELMDEESVQNASFTFSQGIEVLEASPFDPPTLVQLQLSEALEVGTTYTLTIEGLLDCSLNALPVTTINVQLGQAPELYDLLITEIMADPTPSVGLPEAEYFELYNASDKVIQLQGCDISGNVFMRERLLQPQEYALCVGLSQVGDFLFNEGLYIVDDLSGSFLTNGGRELLLTNASGEFVDRVNYSEEWYGDNSKQDGGWSLERINLDEPCRGKANWTASTSSTGGTPGAQNAVNSEEPDLEPPLFTTALVFDGTQVEVRFSEEIDPESVGMAEFTVSDGVGVIDAEAIGPDFVAVSLLLGSALQQGTVYSLTVAGIADCVGNLMPEPTTRPIASPEVGEPGDILINEVLFNVASGEVEFIEVINVSEKSVGLQGWTIENQSGTSRLISDDPLVIFPGAYKVFTPDPDLLIGRYPLGRQENFEKTEIPSLTNSGGSVILFDEQLQEMDRFDYSEDFHLSLLSSFQGVSLERLSFTRPTNDVGNWTSAAEAAGFATPGYLNSQFLPEGTSSGQFELENEVFSPDNDGFQDVLLINYKVNNPGYIATIQIFDRRGRVIRELTRNQIIGTQGTISWDGTTDNRGKARIGPHIVLIQLFDLNGEQEVYKLPCIVAGRLGG